MKDVIKNYIDMENKNILERRTNQKLESEIKKRFEDKLKKDFGHYINWWIVGHIKKNSSSYYVEQFGNRDRKFWSQNE